MSAVARMDKDFAAMEDRIAEAGRNQLILARSGRIYVPCASSVSGVATRNSNFEFGEEKQSLEKGLR